MGTMTRYQKSVHQTPDTQTWSLTEKQTIQTDCRFQQWDRRRNTSCYTAAQDRKNKAPNPNTRVKMKPNSILAYNYIMWLILLTCHKSCFCLFLALYVTFMLSPSPNMLCQYIYIYIFFFHFGVARKKAYFNLEKEMRGGDEVSEGWLLACRERESDGWERNTWARETAAEKVLSHPVGRKMVVMSDGGAARSGWEQIKEAESQGKMGERRDAGREERGKRGENRVKKGVVGLRSYFCCH